MKLVIVTGCGRDLHTAAVCLTFTKGQGHMGVTETILKSANAGVSSDPISTSVLKLGVKGSLLQGLSHSPICVTFMKGQGTVKAFALSKHNRKFILLFQYDTIYNSSITVVLVSMRKYNSQKTSLCQREINIKRVINKTRQHNSKHPAHYASSHQSFHRSQNFGNSCSSQAMPRQFAHKKRCLIVQIPPADLLFSSTQFCTASPENEWV